MNMNIECVERATRVLCVKECVLVCDEQIIAIDDVNKKEKRRRIKYIDLCCDEKKPTQ